VNGERKIYAGEQAIACVDPDGTVRVNPEWQAAYEAGHRDGWISAFDTMRVRLTEALECEPTPRRVELREGE